MRSGLKVSRANLIIVKPGAVHGRLSRKEVNLVPAASLPPSGKVVMKPTQEIPEPRDGEGNVPMDNILAPGTSYA